MLLTLRALVCLGLLRFRGARVYLQRPPKRRVHRTLPRLLNHVAQVRLRPSLQPALRACLAAVDQQNHNHQRRAARVQGAPLLPPLAAKRKQPLKSPAVVVLAVDPRHKASHRRQQSRDHEVRIGAHLSQALQQRLRLKASRRRRHFLVPVHLVVQDR